MTISFHEVTKDPIPPLKVRLLCKDPLVAEQQDLGLVEVTLDAERYLEEGPTTARAAVIDYDATLDMVFAPVQVLKSGAGFAVGSPKPFRENFWFHQQNVWAIVNRIVGILEHPRLFGRPIPWASGMGRILLLPHAGYGRNAFYDRDTGAIHFLYFEAAHGPVFTCLSHDIITHELGHAVLDGLKPYYNEISSAQMSGFHEYVGDALAIASSLTIRELLVEVVGKHPGETLPHRLIGFIGEEFGSADGRSSLRDAALPRTMDQLEGNREEHCLSQVLTNILYELLVALYPKKLALAKRTLGKSTVDGQVAVRALVNAAAQATNTMLRALDYCPPVDLTYLEYARAVLRADEVAYPDDESGTRDILRTLFLNRGVVTDVAQLRGPILRNRDLHAYDIDVISSTTAHAYRFIDANRRPLGLPRDANLSVIRLYRTRKESPSRYYPPREIVFEFVWTEDVLLVADGVDFGGLANTRLPLFCGGTLVFDTSGNVLHYTVRNGAPERRQELLDHVAYLVDRGRIGVTAHGAHTAATAAAVEIVAHVENGRAHLRRVPALRHEGEWRSVSLMITDNAPQLPTPAVDWSFPAVARVDTPPNLTDSDWQHLRERIRHTAGLAVRSLDHDTSAPTETTMTDQPTTPDAPAADRTVDPLSFFLSSRRQSPHGLVPARPFESGEHIWLASAGAKAACETLQAEGRGFADHTIFQSIKRLHSDDRLSYGEIVALSGDFYRTPTALFEEEPDAIPALWQDHNLGSLKEMFAEELAWIQDQQQHKNSYPDNNLAMAWHSKGYVELALDNVDHFGWHNMKMYVQQHRAALDLASQAAGQSNETWRRALFTNAFADHFLTDGFAAGHIRVPRAQIRAWAPQVDYSDKLAGALSKLLHDQDGHIDTLHSAGEGHLGEAEGLRVRIPAIVITAIAPS